MRVVPLLTDLLADPPEPDSEAIHQLRENKAFHLILARLQRKALLDSFSDDDSKLMKKARNAEGVQEALGVIAAVLRIKEKKHQED